MPTKPDHRRAPEEIAEDRIAEWRADHALRSTWDREHAAGFGSGTRMLNLSRLRLKEVPPSILNLDELEVIDLGFNAIRELPEWICELGKIRAINLAGNRLRRWPQRFGSLRELRLLWLEDNDLKELPASLEGLALEHVQHQIEPLKLPLVLVRVADMGHIRQVLELYRAHVFYPEMGAYEPADAGGLRGRRRLRACPTLEKETRPRAQVNAGRVLGHA